MRHGAEDSGRGSHTQAAQPQPAADGDSSDEEGAAVPLATRIQEANYKTCTLCQQAHARSKFGQKRNTKDGLDGYCRICSTLRRRFTTTVRCLAACCISELQGISPGVSDVAVCCRFSTGSAGMSCTLLWRCDHAPVHTFILPRLLLELSMSMWIRPMCQSLHTYIHTGACSVTGSDRAAADQSGTGIGPVDALLRHDRRAFSEDRRTQISGVPQMRQMLNVVSKLSDREHKHRTVQAPLSSGSSRIRAMGELYECPDAESHAAPTLSRTPP